MLPPQAAPGGCIKTLCADVLLSSLRRELEREGKGDKGREEGWRKEKGEGEREIKEGRKDEGKKRERGEGKEEMEGERKRNGGNEREGREEWEGRKRKKGGTCNEWHPNCFYTIQVWCGGVSVKSFLQCLAGSSHLPDVSQ